jgi:hypothetical protein
MRAGAVVVLACALSIASACGDTASHGSSSPVAKSSTTPSPHKTASPSPVPSPSAETLPAGFPSDFPIYPRSRLIQQAKFSGGGQTNWGLEWTTADSTTKAQAFFMTRLSSRDWVLLTHSGSASTSYTDGFRRNSDPRTSGTVQIAAGGAITKISVVITTP